MLAPIPTLPPPTPVPGWWVADMLKLGIAVMELKANVAASYFTLFFGVWYSPFVYMYALFAKRSERVFGGLMPVFPLV